MIAFLESPKTVCSIAHFLACIKENWEDWEDKANWDPKELPWFRGVHRDSYDPIPSIYRGKETLGCVFSREGADAELEDMKPEFRQKGRSFS